MATFGLALVNTERRLDFPALGKPMIPISAMTFSCNQMQKISPLVPSVFFLAALLVELLNRTFPKPFLPPLATIIFCPAFLRS